MSKKLLLLLLIIFPAELIAQTETEDVVYLKNGSILRGDIVEIKANEFVKIEITGRNILVIDMQEVDEIKKEQTTVSQYFKTKGYINLTGVEILPGNNNSTQFRYQMVNGYQFNPFFSAGLGVGFVGYSNPLDALPVFLDFRFNFKAANNTPFLFLKTGYNFSLFPEEENWALEDYSGGWMLNPGVGLQFYRSDMNGFYISAGYNIDKLSYEERDWNGRILETKLTYKRINFGFGLAF